MSNCQYCGKELVRKQFKSKKEDMAVFRKRKYCDRECMRKAYIKVGYNTASFTDSHATARKIKELFIDIDYCEICGKKGRLDVHHKDHDYNNNNLDNLMVLCRSCHSKIHHPKQVCIICGKPMKGLGYCEKHYQRFKTTGNPLLTKYDLRKRVVL